MAARCLILGAEPGLMADTQDWFQTHPVLPPHQLEVSAVQIITDTACFETLLRVMRDSPERSFVICTHGDPSGLFIRLAKKQSVPWGQPTWPRYLNLLMELAAPSAQITEFYTNELALSTIQIQRLRTLMLEVRNRNLDQIEFRSCRSGANPDTPAVFRRFFGAARLGMPTSWNVFGSITPGAGPQTMQTHLSPGAHPAGGFRHFHWDLHNPSGRVALCFRVDANTNKLGSLAGQYSDSMTTFDRWWRANVVANPPTYNGNERPFHYMHGPPPNEPGDDLVVDEVGIDEIALPHTNRYRRRIRYATR